MTAHVGSPPSSVNSGRRLSLCLLPVGMMKRLIPGQKRLSFEVFRLGTGDLEAQSFLPHAVMV